MCEVVLVSAMDKRKERGGGDTAATVDPVGQGGWAESCIQTGMGHERERGAREVAFEQRPEPGEGPGAMHIPGEEHRMQWAWVQRPPVRRSPGCSEEQQALNFILVSCCSEVSAEEGHKSPSVLQAHKAAVRSQTGVMGWDTSGGQQSGRGAAGLAWGGGGASTACAPDVFGRPASVC